MEEGREARGRREGRLEGERGQGRLERGGKGG